MNLKSIKDLDYDFELERVAKEITKQKAKKVLIQLPEGLKPYAVEIADILKKQAKAEIFIWMDSCFGACDIPLETEKLGIDMIVPFGHSNWNFKGKKNIKVVK